MDVDERDLFDKSVRQALASGTGADDALEAVGWPEVLTVEPRDAVSVVFGALGDLDVSASCLDDVMLDAFGDAANLGDALALPAFGGWGPAGILRNGALDLDGLAFARIAHRETVVVPALDGNREVLATVNTGAVECTAVHGLDPTLGLAHVRATSLSPVSTAPLEPDAWEQAVAAGRRALATEIVGAGRAMLRFAREHALTREQFGRPIGQFQAVRHRLAEAYVALEAADAAVVSAWDVPVPMTAMLAKSLAGRSARVATTHCQQVLAGIGFTTDHPLHRYVKRVAVLDGLLGSSFTLPRELGSTLLASRQVPRLLDL
jgi:hypothetical protein